MVAASTLSAAYLLALQDRKMKMNKKTYLRFDLSDVSLNLGAWTLAAASALLGD